MASSFDSFFTGSNNPSSDEEKIQEATVEISKLGNDIQFTDITAFSEEAQQIAIYRHSWLKELYHLNIHTFSQKSLDAPLSKIHLSLGGEKPNWRTIARWHDAFQKSGRKIVALIPRKKTGNSSAKVPELTEEFIQKALKRLLCAERPSIASGHRYLEEVIFLYNKNTGAKLLTPSYETLRKRFNAVSPYDKMAAIKGKRKADQEFQKVGMIIKSTRVLEHVEIDHTPLDLFIIDDEYMLPIGRPYLTALYDNCTKSIIGYYIGFEPPSLVSVAYALKNAILPKTWLKKTYPQIKNEWLCSGIPEQIVVDNATEFWSPIFDNICFELNIDIKHHGKSKPWRKPNIERYFGTLNREIFTEIPGKSFSNIFEREDYNSQNFSVLTLSALKEIVATWVVDVYLNSPNSRNTNIPSVSWRKAVTKFPPMEFEGSEQELDFHLGHIKSGRLRKEGITFNYLRYHSDELALMRATHGDHSVQIKYNPEDLSFIYVLDQSKEIYIIVPAVDTEYTNGLSLWSHKLHVKYLRKHVKENFDINDLIEARIKIRSIIEESISSKKTKITGKKRASRYIEKDNNVALVKNSEKAATPTESDDDWSFDDNWTSVIEDG